MSNIRLNWRVLALIAGPAILLVAYFFGFGENRIDRHLREPLKSPAPTSAAPDATTAAEVEIGITQDSPFDSDLEFTVDNRESNLTFVDFEPADLYRKYVDRATEGDLNAAYVLLISLRTCRDVPETEDRVREVAVLGNLSEQATEFELSMFRKCEPLLSSIPDLRGELDSWYQKIRDDNHPLLLVQQRNRSYEETRARVLRAISQSYPEPFLYRNVYGAASRLFLEFPSERYSQSHFHAWQLLACSSGFECDYYGMRESLKSELSSVQFDEIETIVQDLRDSLERGDFANLGF